MLTYGVPPKFRGGVHLIIHTAISHRASPEFIGSRNCVPMASLPRVRWHKGYDGYILVLLLGTFPDARSGPFYRLVLSKARDLRRFLAKTPPEFGCTKGCCSTTRYGTFRMFIMETKFAAYRQQFWRCHSWELLYKMFSSYPSLHQAVWDILVSLASMRMKTVSSTGASATIHYQGRSRIRVDYPARMT